MTILQAILLGVIQGITEFLPISSSGHLVILPFFLNWNLREKEMFIFDVLVQLGTLVAVIIYFRRELIAIAKDFFKQLFKGTPFASHEARLGWLLILATIPAGLAGLLFQDVVENAFSSPLFSGIALLITAVLLFLGERISQNIGDIKDITVFKALIMGLMQSLALFPGISRSGATISGGMMCHLKRESAGRFSFLMSIPIMLAAGALSTYQMITEVSNLTQFVPTMIIGFLSAMIVGYIAIRWLLRFLVNHSMVYFSVYCALLGGVTILISILQ
ncbi:MAG: undecaprenyl-diphosphatase UppP [Chloroflexota bacterium]|jgi:undecaprenyl-diphosphatase|nr:undecaprenyl-diphosphatase UppP [Chloroflexota bacterium]